MTLALLLTAATGAWAQGVTASKMNVPDSWQNGSSTITADDLPGFVAVTEGEAKAWAGAPKTGGAILIYGFSGSDLLYVDFQDGAYNKSWSNTLNHSNLYTIKNAGATIYYTCDIEIITNAEEGEKTFTEATFQMPAYEATAEYELVRDMSVQMTAQVGDGTDGVRYRVKKDGSNKFIPADMEMAAVPALFTVNDAIEQKALTQTQDYIVQIYAIDAEGQPTGDPMTFDNFTFEPGIYAVKAVAADGSDYDGTTLASNTFLLYDYINITFPKGYSTHYYNESLVLDEIRNSLKFYAVTAVTSEKVTLTEITSKAIPAQTPFIVYNETPEPITAVMGMLMADVVTSAEQFKGTAEDKIMGSQSNCYVLRNGDSTPTFRLVKGAGTLPAHRCYIDLGAAAGARALGFDFGDGTTGIDSVESGELKVDSYYDLQGRKRQGTPQRKGVYVKAGRKEIVK